MKKIVLIIIYCVFLSLNTKSGTLPEWAWGHTFNASVSAIEYSGNYIYTAGGFANGPFIFGNANIPNNGSRDVVIIKWDTLGNMIWATSIWGAGDDSVVSIKVNANNELVVTGSSLSSPLHAGANILTGNGGWDIYTAIFDLNGNALGAYIYGTANHEYAIDMCTDYQSNIYIASANKLTRYNSAGIQIWQKIITATQWNFVKHVVYSSYDSTIHLCGEFAGTFALDNYTVSIPFNNGWNFWPFAVYIAKLTVNGSTLWLKEYSNQSGHSGWEPGIYVNNATGEIYVAHSQEGVADSYFRFFELFSDGNYENQIWGGLPHPQGWDQFYGVETYSMSGNGNYVSIQTDDNPDAFLIYDVSTHTLIKTYDLSIVQTADKHPHIFRGLHSIYQLGVSQSGNYKFGKIGGGALNGAPYNQMIEACTGSITTLTGNITGGIGPLTYNWLPATGLNNTNTNTVSFTATNNISYTLTVTDSIGQTAKDTFNIIVQNPIPTANISSQFPTFCDSMQLYVNNGVAGDWYKLIPGNQWQFISNDTTITIFAAGKYRYEKTNSCNSATDTIDIAGNFVVTASTTSDSVCAGQSVTLSGSGAVNYSWTGGVTDNVPFNLLTTQIYVVTGTDANGCSNTSFIEIVVNTTMSITNIYICANQTPYTWNTLSLDSTGVYNDTLVNMYGCDSIATIDLTVSPCIVCQPDFIINYSPFYNSLTESQTWIITSGTVLIPSGTNVKLDANSNSHVSLNPGFKAEYGAVFVAQAYNGCTAGAPQLPQLGKIMNTDLFASAEIVLYPNPTTGMIHIKHDEKLAGIQIFDMVGKLIIDQKCEGEIETNIDLSNLPSGVYHVKATGYNSIKVIKEN